jgi:hypothetical protein
VTHHLLHEIGDVKEQKHEARVRMTGFMSYATLHTPGHTPFITVNITITASGEQPSYSVQDKRGS